MTIPFIDLKTQYQLLEHEIRERIDRVLEHGKFIMGPEIAELEGELRKFSGVKHAVVCSSGTDALLMALMAYDVGPGDAVFTTPFTFISTAEVIALLGARPVFVDIDDATFNIDPGQLRDAIDSVVNEGEYKPRGIIPVDIFGLPADYDPIMDLAEENNLFVLEDAAQSFGSTYKGRRAGSLGDIAATSFFPAKPLGCYGDGGAILTDQDKLAELARSIRVHGKGTDKYDNLRIGLNGRLDTLQAAILLPKLHAFPGELDARQRVAARYTEGLQEAVKTPYIPGNMTSAWAQYSILVKDRPAVQAALREVNIPTAIYYPKPLHLQAAFRGLGYPSGSLPVAEHVANHILSLPMHPYLSDEQIGDISRHIIDAVSRSG